MKTILMWALWVLGLAGVISGGGTPFAKSEQQAGIFAPYQDQARQLLDQMTPEQKIGQVFLVRCPEDSQLEQVQALAAGADFLIVSELPSAVQAVDRALEQGTLSWERVEEAALRVLEWKLALGLMGRDAATSK